MSEEGRTPIKFGILTVSDSCFQEQAEDRSGSNLEALINEKRIIPNGEVVLRTCVPDEIDTIKRILIEWVDEKDVDVILTTGGTGFSPRDVTPDATRKVIEKETPGLTIAMLQKSINITPFAMLSRAVSGIRHQTLIVNLPGSTKGSQECLESVAVGIPHAVSLLRDRLSEVKLTHNKIQSSSEEVVHSSSSSEHGHHGHHHHHNMHHHHHHHHSMHRHHHHGGHTCGSKVDPSRVARRERVSPYPAIDVEVAQAIVLEQADILGVERVPFMKALGRVLAEDVRACDPLPPFPASIKDGYAVLAQDGAGKRQVLGSSVAGINPAEQKVLQPGYCVRINTGAPVPAGADAVVQVEDTKLLQEADDGKTEVEIEILKAPEVGLDIRPVGSDIAKDQLVLSKGCVLISAELGLLATVGVTTVLVHRVPTVSVLSTGNEIQDPNAPLTEGYIRDSNKTTLLALMKEHNVVAVDQGIAKDDPHSVLTKLKDALADSDVVITTGGVSMGEKDLLKDVLVTDFHATIHFGRVQMKPGKPTTFATCMYEGKKKLLLCLPGNPVSATVTSHLYVLPALRKMSGHPSPLGTTIKATVDKDIFLDSRPEYHRAILKWDTDSPVPKATSTGNQISSRLLSFYSANCLLKLPAATPHQEMLSAGTMVDALVIARL